MEISEAISTLQRLADGIDPTTGEIFPGDSPYQQPKVIRALFTALKAMEQVQQRQERQRALPENAGKPWTDWEDNQLCEGFDRGMTGAQLAQQHKRTRGSIAARLVKLGKLANHWQLS